MNAIEGHLCAGPRMLEIRLEWHGADTIHPIGRGTPYKLESVPAHRDTEASTSTQCIHVMARNG